MILFNDLWQLLRAHGSSAKGGTIYKRMTFPKGSFPSRR